jgi:uncharacterized protein YdhG (YjbR/CyaY superfamily)
MAAPKKRFGTMDEYIQTFPKDVQRILQTIRRTIQQVAPKATEAISYQIPAFKLNGRNLIYFAAWKEHVALYPIPPGSQAFKKELAPYVGGKGTVRFRLNESVPYDLVKKIVKYRLKQDSERASAKRK